MSAHNNTPSTFSTPPSGALGGHSKAKIDQLLEQMKGASDPETIVALAEQLKLVAQQPNDEGPTFAASELPGWAIHEEDQQDLDAFFNTPVDRGQSESAFAIPRGASDLVWVEEDADADAPHDRIVDYMTMPVPEQAQEVEAPEVEAPETETPPTATGSQLKPEQTAQREGERPTASANGLAGAAQQRRPEEAERVERPSHNAAGSEAYEPAELEQELFGVDFDDEARSFHTEAAYDDDAVQTASEEEIAAFMRGAVEEVAAQHVVSPEASVAPRAGSEGAAQHAVSPGVAAAPRTVHAGERTYPDEPLTRADFAKFRCIYESRDGRLALYEDSDGHLAAINTANFA